MLYQKKKLTTTYIKKESFLLIKKISKIVMLKTPNFFYEPNLMH